MSNLPPPTLLEYARPSSNPRRKTHPVMWIIGTLVAGALLTSILLPSRGHSRPTANLIKCGSNLRQIGQAMQLYSNDHGGRFPDTMGELLEEDMTTAVFVCPSSNDTPAIMAPTTQAAAINLHAGGHLSYIYLGKGRTNTARADVILAYEPLANHQGTGMNVLFGDGHVEFFNTLAAKWLLSEIAAGHNPPAT